MVNKNIINTILAIISIFLCVLGIGLGLEFILNEGKIDYGIIGISVGIIFGIVFYHINNIIMDGKK